MEYVCLLHCLTQTEKPVTQKPSLRLLLVRSEICSSSGPTGTFYGVKVNEDICHYTSNSLSGLFTLFLPSRSGVTM